MTDTAHICDYIAGLYLVTELRYRLLRIHHLKQFRVLPNIVLGVARQFACLEVDKQPFPVFQKPCSDKRYRWERYASTSCSAVGDGRRVYPNILLMLRPFVLFFHRLFPPCKVGRKCVVFCLALLYLDRGYRYLVTIRCLPSRCSRPLDNLCVGHRLADRYGYREAVRCDGLVILVRYFGLVALVDDVQLAVGIATTDSVVHAYLSVLPLGDYMTDIEFDSLIHLVNGYIPHDAPKHSALIEIDFDLFSAVNDLEPIYRQNESSAWGKHKFVFKGDGI